MKLFSKQYFSLIKEFSLAWSKERDQRTLLGILWNFLNPLIVALILFVIFRKNLSSSNYYFLYILIGTISWNFLSVTVQSTISVLLHRQEIVKNIAFHKEILVFAQFGVYFIQHLFEILIVLIFIFILGKEVSIHIIFLPLIIVLESILIIGLALLLSIVCVYAQDMEYIWASFARIGFFLTPIFYSINQIPTKLRLIVTLNPITQIITFYRNILIDHRYPNFLHFSILAGLSLLFLTGSFLFFKKFERKIAEKV